MAPRPALARGAAPGLLLALGVCAAPTPVARPAPPPEAACADDDARWAARGKSCQQMRLLCLDGGAFGDLVRASCPRACGLCERASGEAAASATGADGVPGDAGGDSSDEVVLLNVKGALDPEDEVSYAQRGVTAAGARPSLLGGARAPEAEAGPGLGGGRRRNASAAADRTDSPGLLWLDVADSLDDARESNATTSRNGTRNATSAEEAAVLATGLRSNDTQNVTSLDGGPEIVVTSVRRSATMSAEEHPEILITGSPRIAGRRDAAAARTPVVAAPDPNASRGGALGEGAVTVAELLRRLSGMDAEDEEEQRCPPGYERVVGHIDGGDQWSGTHRSTAESIDACALRCTGTPGCGSFQYSRAARRCLRKTQTRPTKPGKDRPGFAFCRRAPCPNFKTKEACTGPALPRDRYSASVRLRPGSYCIWSGGACQAPLACSDQDCFLPDGGLPGMELPPRYTLWISKQELLSSMEPITNLAR